MENLNNTHILVMFLLSIYAFSQGLYVLSKYKNTSSLLFSILIITASIWSFLNTFTQLNIFSIETLDRITKFIYFIGTIISIEFYIFCRYLSDINRTNNLYLIILICILTLPIYLFTDLIIGKYHYLNGEYYWDNGKYILFFIAEFYYFVISGFIILFKHYFKNKHNEFKSKNILSLIVLFLLGFIPPSILSIIFPVLGFYKFDWLSVIFIPLWLVLVWFTIIRKNIFEIKVNTIELGIFLFFFSYLSIIIIVRTINEFLIYTLGIVSYSVLSVFLLKINKEKEENENIIKILSNRLS